MRMNIWILGFSALLFASCACNQTETTDEYKPEETEIKKFIEVKNQENVGIEDQQIDDYLNRRNWSFQKTKSGLRFLIYENGSGIKPSPGNTVQLEYSLNLIRGEQIYTSKNGKPMRFTVDMDDVPSGLNEFVKMMKVGDKAKLIVPSYLGFGVSGDDDKIPARATLFYDLQLVRVFN